MEEKKVRTKKKKRTLKGSFLGKELPELTKTEAEILYYINEEGLDNKQISIRRQTGKRAVQKIRNKLIKKGFLKKDFTTIQNLDVVTNANHNLANLLRFHGVEFNIKILHKDYRYKKILQKCNIMEIDGNTIRLFRDAIEVYVNKSFFGKTVSIAKRKGFEYFKRLFTKIENDLNILIVKHRYQNIRMVKQHYAEMNNELAKDINLKKEKLQIKGKDGKTWLLIDNSWNVNELETVHPDLAQKDMENIKPFFDDLRKYPALSSDILLLIQELSKQVIKVSEQQEVNTLTLKTVVDLFKPVGSNSKKTAKGSKPAYVG